MDERRRAGVALGQGSAFFGPSLRIEVFGHLIADVDQANPKLCFGVEDRSEKRMSILRRCRHSMRAN
jgi:hypothetical protein